MPPFSVFDFWFLFFSIFVFEFFLSHLKTRKKRVGL